MGINMLNIFKTLAENNIPKLDGNSIGIPTVTANDVLASGLNITYMVLGAVAVLVIVIAGFKITVSGGNPDSVAKARNWILYAAIGLIVAVLAFVITNFVIGKF